MSKITAWGLAFAAISLAQGAMAQVPTSSHTQPPTSSNYSPAPSSTVQQVPEPSSMPLVLLGLVGVVVVARFIKRK